MEITTLLAFLRRWWLFLLLGVAGVGIAFVVVTLAPKQYESAVTLQLNPSARGALLAYTSESGTTSSVAALAASYNEVLRSRSFGELVVRQLNLNTAPETIAAAVSARLVPNTNILRLTVAWSDPQDAQQLAQAVADIFVAENARRQGAQPGGESGLAQMEETARNYPGRVETLRRQRDQLDQAVSRGDLTRLQELNSIDIRLAATESSYANLLVEINRARSNIDTASILDSASPARTAGRLPMQQTLVFGLLGGLALAAGLTLFLKDLDDRLRTPEDIMGAVGTAPLAAVGRIDGGDGDEGRQGRLVALHAPQSATAEAFRTLTANLRFAATDHAFRALVITSSGAGEGKTLVASNLAITLAQAGVRVLLVDADLRRPSIHKTFVVANERGLVDALTEAAVAAGDDTPWSRREAARTATLATTRETVPGVIASGVEDLWLMPSGRLPSNPGAALGSQAAARLVEQIKGLWDIVILDTAPVGPISDTLLLATHADAILLVARSGQTRKGPLQRASEALQQTGQPIVGVVLNDFRVGRLARYYGGYSSSYYYNYGSGYTSESSGANGHSHGQRGEGKPRGLGRRSK